MKEIFNNVFWTFVGAIVLLLFAGIVVAIINLSIECFIGLFFLIFAIAIGQLIKLQMQK